MASTAASGPTFISLQAHPLIHRKKLSYGVDTKFREISDQSGRDKRTGDV